MKRIRIGTLLLLIAIVALTMTVVIQQRRWGARQQQLVKDQRQLLTELRDSRSQTLKLKAQEFIRLVQEVGSRNDPKVKAAAAELEKLRSDYNATMDRLKALQLIIDRRAP